MTTGRDQGLPPGYEWVDLDHKVMLALPAEVARASLQEIEQREDSLADARRDALRRRQEEKMAQTLAEGGALAAQGKAGPAGQGDFSAPPGPGWYRILPQFQALLAAGHDENIALRAVDEDVRARHTAIRKILIEKGPDRQFVQPVDWRISMDALESSLPHFKAPIRMLRNTLALAEATQLPVRVPPMLLLGPPGVGKTHFSHLVAEMMGASHAALAFDQPSAGTQLCGSDKYYSNSESGLLFNLICLGEHANPVILLDEIDKCTTGANYRQANPLAQLHGALEPQTARRMVDASNEILFDSSLVTYIATANSLRGIGAPLLSRLEVFCIEPPDPSSAVDIARAIVTQVLGRLNLAGKLRFERKGFYVLAHLSPRLMLRTVEKAVASAIAAGQAEVMESDLWAEFGWDVDGPRPH